ncbi:MAG: cation:proton antiporter, partial [Candidatus Omnitrophica bacterium]|nr:cation:proton antiporter [Candidatus Omnitrophota bacterium]
MVRRLGGGGLIGLLFLIGFFVLPRIIKNIAKSQELLFLFSICWCFIIAALFSYFGFSIEIGALVAGVVLSISPYSTEISSKVRPLRDFFLIIFFIILGFNFPTSNLMPIIKNAVILSALVLIFKPLILMSLMALFGYTKRNNFLVGTTLAQISEFSLILIVLGLSVHGTLLDPGILP